MPGMNKNKGNGSSNGSGNNGSPPLQSFSELSLASIRGAMSSPESAIPELKPEERGLYLIQLLLLCANYVTCGNMEQTNMCMEQISNLASLTGDPMQRLATYFMEGLAARITKAWRGLHRALNSTQLPSIADIVSARQVFYNLFPYLRFASDAVNLMIVDAMEGEKVVHVIDLDASDPAQWVSFFKLLSHRQGGPPHLKITGVHEKREILQQTAATLTEEAERLDIPFQFNPVVSKLDHLTEDMLKVKTGEAVAVSSVLQLHPLLADDGRSSNLSPSPSPSPQIDRLSPLRMGKRPRESFRDEDLLRSMFINHRSPPAADRTLGDLLERDRSSSRPVLSPSEIEAAINSRRSDLVEEAATSGGGNLDRFLRMLRGLSPKIMVVVEQESNHNGAQLVDRLMEALFYYGAMFDCLESALPQHCIERVTLEKHMFGRQIQNIVACEGSERVERHEKLERWIRSLDRAGFASVPLSYATLMHAQRLVQSYNCEAYRLVEEKGCLTICWQEQNLYSVSAWRS